MHRKVSHRLHFAWVPSIGTPKGLLTTLQHETSSFLHSMSNSSTNCKNAQPTLKNKRSGAIGVAGVAHGKSRRRLRKRIRQMKSAGDGTGALYGGRVMRPAERKFKNKRSGAISVAGVAHGKSRRRLHKRIRRMKPAKEGTE